jgi:hypothetical protein
MDPADHIVLGSMWRTQTVKGHPPPLVPSLPIDGSDWDASIIPHDYKADIDAERRHSGWAAVENRWANSQVPEEAKAKRYPPLSPSLSRPVLMRDV